MSSREERIAALELAANASEVVLRYAQYRAAKITQALQEMGTRTTGHTKPVDDTEFDRISQQLYDITMNDLHDEQLRKAVQRALQDFQREHPNVA